MPRRTKSTPTNEHELLCKLGDELRSKFGRVRYIQETFHNGRQWTIRECWERYDDPDAAWIEIEWTEVGGMHSAHQ